MRLRSFFALPLVMVMMGACAMAATYHEIIPEQEYTEFTPFVGGVSVVTRPVEVNTETRVGLVQLKGLLNAEGKEILPPTYDHIFNISEGMASVSLQGLGGFIKTTGELVVPPTYDIVAYPYVGGYTSAFRYESGPDGESGWTILDKEGRAVDHDSYYTTVTEGLYAFTQDKKSGFKNLEGQVVIEPVYENELGGGFKDRVFSYGLAAMKRDGKWGYIDTKGQVVIPFVYQEADHCRYNTVCVQENGVWIEVDAAEYKKAAGIPLALEEGLYSFPQGDKYGFKDAQGNTVIEPIYDLVRDGNSIESRQFHEGLAAACLNGKWGYIDSKGNTVIPFDFDFASPVNQGIAQVGRGGTWEKLDVTPYKQAAGMAVEDGLPIDRILQSSEQNGKWGMVNILSKETLVPFEYDGIAELSEGIAWAMKDGKPRLLVIEEP